MKTSWDSNYINQRYGNQNFWKREKQKEFETKTGVKWSAWTAHGKAIFAPCRTRETSECTDDTVLKKVMHALPCQANAMHATTFLQLASATRLSLANTVSAAKTLCQQTKVVAVVCRMGKPIAIYRSNKGRQDA